ncbi:MAG: DNA-directed DNA polymerase [Candidatus Woesearchaeota archaeon]
MVAVQFYPVDATYKVVNGKPQVYLFGRTIAGEQVCVIDANIEPYFYVIPRKGEDPTADLLKLKAERMGENYSVVRVEPVKKKYIEQPVDALKVFVNLPKAVSELKDAVRALPGVLSMHEYDIQFVRRYFIDKGITPLTLVNAEGEPAVEKLKVPAIKASKIEQAAETTLAKPRVMTVDIETYNPSGKHVSADKHPILMIGLVGDNFKKVLTWKKIEGAEKYVEFLPSEADVLDRFADLVNEYKPDMISGYYSDGFDFPYIRARATKNRVSLDLGLDYSELRIEGRASTAAKITGIAHIDILRIVKKLLVKVMETDIFTLDAVAKELLGKGKHSADIEKLAGAWDSNDHTLLAEFAKYNLQDAELAYELARLTMPNLIEMVKIVGQLPYDINRMGFSQLVEWFAMRQAFLLGEIAPNKPSYREQSRRARDRIKGAFVFEPKPGLYENIAVCDYRSLYPTIIASHNISPGMRNCSCCPDAPQIKTDRGTFWYCQKRKGFVSGIIEDLITRRARIKDILRKGDKDQLLHARSWALKDLANSFYGYLGFSAARWYCIECAESTTAWEREYIHGVIEKAKKEDYAVLYSDTDSVFLGLGNKTPDDVQAFVDRINSTLPKPMELEYEGFYPAGIFVAVKASEAGAKKKYALMNQKGQIKIAGFETVRRNWSPIARQTQKRVLELLLSAKKPDAALEYLKKIVDDLKQNKIPLNDVVIHTALSKDISEYESAGPHVAAAQRMQALGQQVGPGVLIRYVVIKGKGRIRDKVKLPEEARQEEYDADYYVNNQLLPGVERIFDVFGIKIADYFAEKEQSALSKFF